MYDDTNEGPFGPFAGPSRGSRRKAKVEHLRDLLKPGMTVGYEYDFGTTTELNIKVIAVVDRATPDGAVEVLARNHAPQIQCDRCGERLAVKICSECAWEGKGWLCKPCAARHKCGLEMLLSVVNSPRVGQCAYGG